MKNYKGYQPDFLGEHLSVSFPELSEELFNSIAPVKGTKTPILHYINYSVIQSAARKFPILSAANIDGKKFKSITRDKVNGSWKKDKRIDSRHQWGQELYAAPDSHFDKGHMTKREDVQWHRTNTRASLAAKETFYYTNAVPQHKNLNQALWRSIEDFILHDNSIDNSLKINVFTGPALRADDLFFVHKVREQSVQIPSLFWKVIYYVKNDSLHRVGFLAGQKGVLLREKIVLPPPPVRGEPVDAFMDFEEADTYQVEVKFIEETTGLTFPDAIDLYWDLRPTKLIMEEVTLRGIDAKEKKIKGLVF